MKLINLFKKKIIDIYIMDYKRIKILKSYVDQIRKFRNLDKFKNMNEDLFKEDMTKLFPDFIEKNKLIFDCIISNKDMHFLDLMFHKLDDINQEFNNRIEELNLIKPNINDIRCMIKVDDNIDKEKINEYLKINCSDFLDKYPIIIERLFNKETRNLSDEQLFYDQIKFKHEKQIGDILANKYVYPKLKKNI
tara:strand:- start:2740 stop:3315 length:576 start_codon:yes stop_codon:yes gene_type:complete